jgi:hypothetical protein
VINPANQPASQEAAKLILETTVSLKGTEDASKLFQTKCIEVASTTKENDGFTIELFKYLGAFKKVSSSSFSSTRSKVVANYEDLF